MTENETELFRLLMEANEADAALPDIEHPGYMVAGLAAATLRRVASECATGLASAGGSE